MCNQGMTLREIGEKLGFTHNRQYLFEFVFHKYNFFSVFGKCILCLFYYIKQSVTFGRLRKFIICLQKQAI